MQQLSELNLCQVLPILAQLSHQNTAHLLTESDPVFATRCRSIRCSESSAGSIPAVLLDESAEHTNLVNAVLRKKMLVVLTHLFGRMAHPTANDFGRDFSRAD